jgi:hypothetical protein
VAEDDWQAAYQKVWRPAYTLIPLCTVAALVPLWRAWGRFHDMGMKAPRIAALHLALGPIGVAAVGLGALLAIYGARRLQGRFQSVLIARVLLVLSLLFMLVGVIAGFVAIAAFRRVAGGA